jgi:hypothetical protein
MTFLRAWLAIILVAVTIYTGIVIARHGLGLLPIFFGDMGALAWPGQFNLDFLGLLSLSALYLAWRHHFTAKGWLIAAGGFLLGAPFLSAYLLIASIRAKGDVTRLLLGNRRTEQVGSTVPMLSA